MTTALFFLGKRNGRPTRADVRSNARVWCHVTPAEREELRRVAKENGVPVAVVIREAVNCYVADYSDRTVFVPRIKK